MYKYIIYGLNIESEFKIRNAENSLFNGKTDIVIYDMKNEKYKCLMDISLIKSGSKSNYLNYYDVYNYNNIIALLFNNECIAYCDMKNKTILYNNTHRNCDMLILCIKEMLIDSYLFLHAAAFAYKDKVIALLADGGVGKSTLLWSFMQRGALFVTDDQLQIKLERDKAIVYPSNIIPKLSEKSMQYYQVYSDNKLYEKYYLSDNKIMRSNENLLLDSIYILEPDNSSKNVILSSIKYDDYKNIIMRNILYINLKLTKTSAAKIKKVVTDAYHLVDHVKLHKVNYKKVFESVPEVTEEILKLYD